MNYNDPDNIDFDNIIIPPYIETTPLQDWRYIYHMAIDPQLDPEGQIFYKNEIHAVRSILSERARTKRVEAAKNLKFYTPLIERIINEKD